MAHIIALLPQLPTLQEIVVWGGYFGLSAIIFSETGLLIGFFLPGDSMLVTAGLLIASGMVDLNILLLDLLLCIAAICGNSSGYWIGSRAGRSLYDRPQSRFFRKDHLLKTKAFYDQYGPITIVMAQFMPFARTFAPVVAGVAEMAYPKFIAYNIIGAVCWIVSMTMIGYWGGRMFPGIEHYIEFVIAVIVLLSVAPMIVKYVKHRRAMTAKPGGELS